MIKLAWRTSKDPVVKFRALWFSMGFAMSLVLVEIGGGYAFAGQRATSSPQAFRVILLGSHLPGGLRTHGWIMVVLGLGLLWGLASVSQRLTRFNWRLVRFSGIAIIGYTTWCAWAFFGAIFINHQYNAGLWWYLFVAILAGAQVSLPPPFRR